MKSLNYAIHRPKLSTVEAGLLLLQRSSKASWPLTAQMVAVGQDIGLYRDCSGWDIPEWEKGLRRRLAWALFMQDKWASLVQGRPSHIFKTDWSVKPLREQDFPENFADENDEEGSTEVEKGRTLFTCMVSLTQILSDIQESLYSAAAEEDIALNRANPTSHVLAKAKPLQIRLKEWFAQLPQHLSLEHIKIRKLCSSGYLHLAYWATEITLHRCIVRTLVSCPDSELVGICQRAALARSQSAMQFVKSLRPEHWQSFWYFASEFGFGLIGVFEMLLCTSFTSGHDIKASLSRLDQYQWMLKMSKKNAGFLEKSIAMIDLAATHSKPQLTQNDVHSKEHRYSQPDQIMELHEEYLKSHISAASDYFVGQLDAQAMSAIEANFHQEFVDRTFFDTGQATEHSFPEDI